MLQCCASTTEHDSHPLQQLLYETMINKIIPTVAAANKQKWTEAAKQWRLPFWDWAIPQSDTKKFGFPNIVLEANVTILDQSSTNGATKTVVNPLNKFTNTVNGTKVRMGDKVTMKQFAIDYVVSDSNGSAQVRYPIPQFSMILAQECQTGDAYATSRYGIITNDSTKAWVNGVVNDQYVQEALEDLTLVSDKGQDTGRKITEATLRLFLYGYTSYDAFATTAVSGNVGPLDVLSLEGVHNHIHVRSLCLSQDTS